MRCEATTAPEEYVQISGRNSNVTYRNAFLNRTPFCSCPGCLVTNKADCIICPCCETRNPKAPKDVAPPKPAPVSSFSFGVPASAAAPAAAGTAASAPAFNFGFGASGAAPASAAPPAAPPAAAPAFNFGFGAAAPAPAAAAPASSGAAAPAGFNFGFGAAAPVAASSDAAGASADGGAKKEKNAPHAFFQPSPFVAPVLPAGLAGPADFEANKPLALSVPAPAAEAAPAKGAKRARATKGKKGAAAEEAEGAAGAGASSSSTAVVSSSSSRAGVFIVGSGECDQLGLGDDTDTFTTEAYLLLKPLARLSVARIATGGLHTLILTTEGSVWSWGCNDDLALGRAGAENRPGLVKGPLAGVPVVAIGAGDSHSVALDATGRVFAWGTYKGSDGYLGFDAVTQKQGTPRLMEGVGAYGRAVSISCGADHTGVVTSDGLALAWGYGGQGQLGKMTTERSLRGNRTAAIALTPYPIRIRAPKLPATAAAGAGASSSSSSSASSRKRGRGGVAAGPSASSGLSATGVFCVGYSTFVATADGRLFACGLNNYGQLGLGHTDNAPEPLEVTALRGVGGGRGVVAMAGGAAHALALAADGAVFSLGRGDSGQLGISGSAREAIPVAASAPLPVQIAPSRFASGSASGCSAVVAVSANTCSSAAVTADGRLFAWGFGESGQMGSGACRDENVPFPVLGGKGCGDLAGEGVAVTGVGMGGQHCVVLAYGGKALAAALAVVTGPAGASAGPEFALDEEPAKAEDKDDEEEKGEGEGDEEDDGDDKDEE